MLKSKIKKNNTNCNIKVEKQDNRKTKETTEKPLIDSVHKFLLSTY